MAIIPTAIIPTKIASNLGFITFFNITIDGTDKAVTPIINVNNKRVALPLSMTTGGFKIFQRQVLDVKKLREL